MTRMSPIFLILLIFFGTLSSSFAEDLPELKIASASLTETPTVTMSVEGIYLKDVLKVLSEQTGFSYVASEEVENKKISLNFDNVSIRDALESIASGNGLRFEQKRGSKVVLLYPITENESSVPKFTETRVFRLKYTRLSISPLDIGGEATIKDLGEAASLSSTETSSGSGTAAAAPGTTLTNLTAGKGIDKVIASLLTQDGRVTVDLHTNSLIVTDTPDNMERLETVIREIDRPSPQVLIEVHLMEVKKNILSDQGMDWGGTNGALASFTGPSRTTGFPFQENIFNASKGVKATSQGTSTLTLGTLSATNFAATLRFITSDTDTRILARPRLLTLNNEAANIKLVTNTSIANTSSTTTAEGTAVTSSNVAERTETGIVLKLTPQINEDDSIGLFVEPSITTVAASSFFPTIFLDPTTRTVRTMARVKNNETLVIGGLLDRSDDVTYKKIPGLGDIPLFGNAFKYKDSNDLKRELLIFITPHIVENYSHLGTTGSGISGWRDPSMEKMLDAFSEEEMQKQMEALQGDEKRTTSVLRQAKVFRDKQKKAPYLPVRQSGALSANTEAIAEMTRALETASRKK